ncbi:MAG: hypothetical protein IJD11_03445 [Oscillospiraceae bacterium]|nr:hypothetical protein [Oscillospiraceae bacterium]
MATEKNNKGTEMKTVRLYKDNDRYKKDVQVIVNGKAYLIQRGVSVEIPASVAEVLENAQAQSQLAIEVSDSIGKQN